MSFIIVIPARYASTRLTGKLLREIAGKPLIQHVFERARHSGAAEVVVATDDERIQQIAENFGATVCMTAADHQSGTDRLAEVARLRHYNNDQIIVNLQGDEPLVPVAVLRQVAQNLAEHPNAALATLCTPVKDIDELFDPHAVKVVRDKDGYALYFSRAPIPWDRDQFVGERHDIPLQNRFFRHIGLYAYRGSFLRTYSQWPTCDLELTEKLEQLRVLWHGYKIHVAVAVETVPPGVDTAADLERVRQILEAGKR